ncbi:MAG: hypothetical protein U9P42_02410 [Candidatus Fermentibacteria bacterium]|nr:hypothetical protein [Candidatus Fermentibacteria bacterium]
MKAVKIILAVAGVTLLFTGLVFVVGSSPVTGAVMLGVGIFMIVFGLRKQKTRDVVIRRELELSGDVNLEGMKCNQCGGILSSENMSVKAGAVFVSCPYCSSEYQIEEAPKW